MKKVNLEEYLWALLKSSDKDVRELELKEEDKILIKDFSEMFKELAQETMITAEEFIKAFIK